MTIRLPLLTAEEVREYVPRLTEAYTGELRKHLHLSGEAAHAGAQATAAAAFPEGGMAPGQSLYAAEGSDGARVGLLWLGEPETAETDVLWVYDIEIDPEHRGRGHRRAAVLLAEEEARRRGRGRIKLNVFGTNTAARALYRSLGYEEMSVQMTKAIDDRPGNDRPG